MKYYFSASWDKFLIVYENLLTFIEKESIVFISMLLISSLFLLYIFFKLVKCLTCKTCKKSNEKKDDSNIKDEGGGFFTYDEYDEINEEEVNTKDLENVIRNGQTFLIYSTKGFDLDESFNCVSNIDNLLEDSKIDSILSDFLNVNKEEFLKENNKKNFLFSLAESKEVYSKRILSYIENSSNSNTLKIYLFNSLGVNFDIIEDLVKHSNNKLIFKKSVTDDYGNMVSELTFYSGLEEKNIFVRDLSLSLTSSLESLFNEVINPQLLEKIDMYKKVNRNTVSVRALSYFLCLLKVASEELKNKLL